MPDRYFLISDEEHGRCVVAGNKFDGGVYHEDPARKAPANSDAADTSTSASAGAAATPAPLPPRWRDNALWRFEKVANVPDYYYIVDRRHGGALSAGTQYDEEVHQFARGNYEGKPEAQWKLVTPTTAVRAPKGVFNIVDRKHGKALVAGDRYDGELYHQDPGARSNALWAVLMASDGDGGPAEYVVRQRLLKISYDMAAATRASLPPQLVIMPTPVSSEEGAQSVTLTPAYTERETDTITLQNSVTTSLMVSLTNTAVPAPGFKLETRFDVKLEAGWSRTTTTTSERTTTYQWQIPVRTSGKTVTVEGELKRVRTTVPFVATIETTFASGGPPEISDEKGEWSHVSYTTGEIRFSD